MAKNFSSVTPDSVGGARSGPPPSAPSAAGTPGAPASGGGAGRRKKMLWAFAVVAVVLLIVLIVGVATHGGSGSSTSAAAPAGPHGPAKIVDGVPTGYTHDKAGAATAAVNFIQAYDLAWSGKIPLSPVQQKMVAQNPTPALVSFLNDAKNRQDTGSHLADLPASTTVLSYTPDAADVSIWMVTAGTTSDNSGGDSPIATWGTTSLHLVWEDGDWKVQDENFHVGPQPGQPLPQGSAPSESGYYSFFVN